jgi:hypothetical protein
MNKIDDYKFNLDLFLDQYKNSDRLQGIVSAADGAANDIETALFEIRDNIYLSTAIGEQLDLLGIVFNEPRAGRDDTEYRIILQIRAASAYSGEPEGIISILKSIYGAGSVQYRPFYPGKYYLWVDIDFITTAILNRISPAGVQGLWEYLLALEDDSILTFEDGTYITLVQES